VEHLVKMKCHLFLFKYNKYRFLIKTCFTHFRFYPENWCRNSFERSLYANQRIYRKTYWDTVRTSFVNTTSTLCSNVSVIIYFLNETSACAPKAASTYCIFISENIVLLHHKQCGKRPLANSPKASGNFGWRVRSTLYSLVWRVGTWKRLPR
jgi:hypothetical protein